MKREREEENNKHKKKDKTYGGKMILQNIEHCRKLTEHNNFCCGFGLENASEELIEACDFRRSGGLGGRSNGRLRALLLGSLLFRFTLFAQAVEKKGVWKCVCKRGAERSDRDRREGSVKRTFQQQARSAYCGFRQASSQIDKNLC